MLLRTGDLTVTYGGLRAVSHLSLDVADGELVGLIGPNGAGKTTFIDAVSGFATSTGRILLEGVPLDGLPPHRRVGRGLVRSFQQVELFDDLDVRGNLLVAAESPAWWRPLVDLVRPRRPGMPPAVERAVGLLGIEHLITRAVSELSEGERKLVGLGRALACSPRLLLLDEPAAGLDSTESLALGARCARSSTPASPFFSSTTTWDSCSVFATASTSSTTASTWRAAHPMRSATTTASWPPISGPRGGA